LPAHEFKSSESLAVAEGANEAETEVIKKPLTTSPDIKSATGLTPPATRGLNKASSVSAPAAVAPDTAGLQGGVVEALPPATTKAQATPATTTAAAPGEAAGKAAKKSSSAATAEPAAAASPAETVPGKAAAVAKVEITAQDPGGILGQLANAPPSAAAAAYTQAEQASAPVLQKQAAELQGSLPQIPAPTGLPPKGADRARKRRIAGGKTTTAKIEGEQSGRKGEKYTTEVPAAPAPPTQQDTYLRGSDQPYSATANAEMAASASQALDSVQLDTAAISVSAGERPSVDTTGDADPKQMEQFKSSSDSVVNTAKRNAALETQQDFGEFDVFPEPCDEVLASEHQLTAQTVAGAKGSGAVPLTADVAGSLDQTLGPVYSKRVGEKHAEYNDGKTKYDKDIGKARSDADREIGRLEEETAQKQSNAQKQVQADVASYRQEWRTAQDKIAKDYQSKAGKATKDQKQKITREKAKAEKKAAQHLRDAERKAAAEKLKAKRKARAEKSKRKKKSGGFRGWARRTASAFVDGLKKAVNFIYDGVRKVVKGIFELAKKLVLGVIEAARRLIVGLIRGFGMILKGIVSIALIAFPDKAKEFNKKIDEAVNASVGVVNTAAGYLKKGVAAVIDFLANTVDKVLGLIQSLYNGLLTVIGMFVRGEIKELMERIQALVNAARQMPSHLEGSVWKQLLGVDISKPMSNQSAVIPASSITETATSSLTVAGESVEATFSDSDIVVEPIVEEVFDPELVADLAMEDGEERVLGERSGEAYSLAGVAADFQTAEAGEAPSTTQNTAKAPAAKPTVSRSENAAKVWGQMKKFMGKWLKDNWGKLLAAVIGALVGIIALTIVTGGSILAALPIIMKIVTAVFVGLALLKAMGYMKTYLSAGWAKKVGIAAKALANALAVGIVELAMALGFRAVGVALKGVARGVAAGARLAVKGVRRGAKAAVSGVKRLMKSGATLISKSGRTVVRGGKLIFTGLKRGFFRGIKKGRELLSRLFARFRFKGIKLKRSGLWIQIWGVINPEYLIGKIKIDVPKSSYKKIKDISKRTKQKFMHRVGAVWENTATRATKAKGVVDSIAGKLAAGKAGRFGRPDNIKTTATGLIKEVEEVKYFGSSTLDDLGKLAKKNPKRFVDEGLSEGKYIQIDKHVNTIEAIRVKPVLVQGTSIKGVSKSVKYVVTLPKFTGSELSKVRSAVSSMKKAWKSILGVDVTVRYGSHTTSEVQKIVKTLEKVR
jgi:hypothetical protein